MTEDQLEQETLGWLAEVGYTHLYGPTIAHDGDSPERENYRQVLLVERLRRAIARLNPSVPLAAREDALKQVVDLGLPIQLSANRLFLHSMLSCAAAAHFPRPILPHLPVLTSMTPVSGRKVTIFWED